MPGTTQDTAPSRSGFTPRDIHAYLGKKVLGQEDVLKTISVAVYKHIEGLRAGNVLLLGDSGTGKTTIMKSIQQFYREHEGLEKHQTMTIMNANVLRGESEGDVDLSRLFKNLENDVHRVLGENVGQEKLRDYMQHATVCVDEVDKISSRIAGKVNPSGIAIQQSLLTLLEGETVMHETTLLDEGAPRRVRFSVDTGSIMFVCGGAFEELYDQVYGFVAEEKDERRLRETAHYDRKGNIQYKVHFTLKEYLKLADLFAYGMVPQFISRFSALGFMRTLNQDVLIAIMKNAVDSPLKHSTDYFATLGIALTMTEEAHRALADHAVRNTRIGARALREAFTRIIVPLEFDPFGSNKLKEVEGGYSLTLDEAMVEDALRRPDEEL